MKDTFDLDWPPLQVIAIEPQLSNRSSISISRAIPSTSETTEIGKQIAQYTKWNEFLVSLANSDRVLCEVLLTNLKEKRAQDAVNAACHSLYSTAQGVNASVCDVIRGLKKEPPEHPTVHFSEIELPDWPVESNPDLFASIWGIARPALQMLAEKLLISHPNAPIIVAITGLIRSGEKVVQVLSTYYPTLTAMVSS